MEPTRVVIVGGGTAGWITAAHMNAALNSPERRVVEFTLIESPDVPRIGVGEATVPALRQLLFNVGIDEMEFMRATDAVFKQGICFPNWLHNKGEHYYHQFSRYNPDAVDKSGLDWLRSDRSIPFADTVSAQPALMEMHLSPKLIGPRQMRPALTYAYHLNALKFADYLRDIAVKDGVSHHIDNVTDIEMTEDGRIAALNTEKGERLEADLFIDCTGFQALLIEKKLGVGWDDFSPWLLCDRAVVMQIPYETYYPGFVRSGTLSSALSAGWIWDIPLINRRAIGYVYSSQFISDDAAEREMRRYEGAYGPHADDLPTRVVPFKSGRRSQAWAKNCVAIGLSGGFMEPLEATGLHLIQFAALTLAEFFPHGGQMEDLAARFNAIISERFDEILGFINMHYCVTQRRDSEFWEEVARPERVIPALQEKLDFWKIKPPSQGDLMIQSAQFSYQSYELVLYGMDFQGEHYAKLHGGKPERARIPAAIANRFERMRRHLPTHEAWLQQSLGMARYEGPARA